MRSFDQEWTDTATPTPEDDVHAWTRDADVEPAVPTPVEETPSSAATRMLELAAVTADQVVTDAKAEAESLVTTAQARADEVLAASRNEADQVAAELARTKAEQAADLDRERARALAGLAEEKAALEAEISRLSEAESDYRNQMRQRLTEQLSMLDRNRPEPPAAVAG
jgi:cell division septum initiation protein DivIVA